MIKKCFIRKIAGVVAFCSVSAFLTACSGTDDNPVIPQEKQIEIKVGDLTMMINPQMGARITSFKYRNHEVLSQLEGAYSSGSTFWTSPQEEWFWPPVPEIDEYSYVVTEEDGDVVMTSRVSELLKLRVVKRFAADVADSAIVITYSIINEGNEVRKVAPWEITRVPNDGVIRFDAPAESIWPAALLDFIDKDGVAYYEADEAPENRKVNADGKGWLSYEAKGLVFTKRFADLTPEQPAPGEAEIQVYVNQGKTYIEIENQGAYTALAPGEKLSWTVRWYLKQPIYTEIKPNKMAEESNNEFHNVVPLQIRFNDVVRTRTAKLGNKSFHLEQEIFDTDTQEVKSRCLSILVLYDLEQKLSMPFPDEWRKAISDYDGVINIEAKHTPSDC